MLKSIKRTLVCLSVSLMPIAAMAAETQMTITPYIMHPPPGVNGAHTPAPIPLYSFTAKNTDIRNVLAMFGGKNHLTIVPDPEVIGKITAVFERVPLRQALSLLVEPLGYFAEISGNEIRIRDYDSRTFHIDYPRLKRTGTSTTQASMSSGGTGTGSTNGLSGGGSTGSTSSLTSGNNGVSGGGGSSGSSSSTINIKSNTSIDFWEEIDTQVKALLTKDGTAVVNKMAGLVSVRDHYANVNRIGKYLSTINHSIHKQVKIVATILNVSTSDTSQIGIDWNRITKRAIVLTSTALTNPLSIAGAALLQPSGSLTLQNKAVSLSAVITALKEQGHVKVVSKPLLVTLNNQSTMIKVGTDRTFFSIQSTTNTTSAGATTQVNDSPRNITLGLVMSITPQISDTGYIIMDISPVITSLAGTDISKSGSTAPRIDVKQITSMVRIRSGESIVIGGLIDQSSGQKSRSVPLLGDIPFIGGLFSTHEKVTSKTELVIFITPTVIHGRLKFKEQ